MTDKVEVTFRYGYLENSTLRSGSSIRARRFGADEDEPGTDDIHITEPEDITVWPMGCLPVTNRISLAITPYPHVVYTRCHQEKTLYFGGCTSTFQHRCIAWKFVNGQATPYFTKSESYNAVYNYCTLWNAQRSTPKVYTVSDSAVSRASEEALLNLWAGRPRRHMNVALALIELRDVKKTITQFAEFSGWGIKVLKGEIKLPAHIASAVGLARGAQMSCRQMAEAYLWYTFGVRPTVQDITTFIKEVSSGKLQVKGSKRKPLLVGRTYANGISVHPPDFAFPAWPDQQTIVSGSKYFNANGGTPVWRYYAKAPSSYANPGHIMVTHVTGKVFAKVREQGKWSWKYFPSSMSWSCPLFRTAWELVPFSFVIDWFLDVGKSIRRLDDLSHVAYTRYAFDEPWMWLKRVTTHYVPVFRSAVSPCISDVKRREGTSNIWDYKYSVGRFATCDWKPEYRKVVFDRGPCSDFGLSYASLWRGLIPEWQGELKAYQITSGMALLESVFKLI